MHMRRIGTYDSGWAKQCTATKAFSIAFIQHTDPRNFCFATNAYEGKALALWHPLCATLSLRCT